MSFSKAKFKAMFLLPVGGEWTAVMSIRWKWFSVYVNVRIMSWNPCDEVVKECVFVYEGKHHHLSIIYHSSSSNTDKCLCISLSL